MSGNFEAALGSYGQFDGYLMRDLNTLAHVGQMLCHVDTGHGVAGSGRLCLQRNAQNLDNCLPPADATQDYITG